MNLMRYSNYPPVGFVFTAYYFSCDITSRIWHCTSSECLAKADNIITRKVTLKAEYPFRMVFQLYMIAPGMLIGGYNCGRSLRP